MSAKAIESLPMIVGMVLLAGTVGCRDAARAAPRAEASQGDSAAPSAATASAAVRPTVVFLGTSLTEGYGLPNPEAEAFPARIQEKIDSAGLNYEVINAGVSGETSAGARRRIDWVMRTPPAVLVIETGANDGLRGQDIDSLEQNIQAMIDRVRALSPETRIMLVGMEALPNMGARYTRRFRAIYPDLARTNGVPLVPFLLKGIGGVDSLNQADGIHPNRNGARRMADNVWPLLRTLL